MLVLNKPFSLHFLQDQAAPTSHPVLSALAWPGHWRKPERKDTTDPGLLLAATAALPISSGTILAGCQVPALPRETCFRRTSKPGSWFLISLNSAPYLRYDLIFQELWLPGPQSSQTPSFPGKGPRGISHSLQGQVRPGHLDSQEGMTEQVPGESRGGL